MTKREKLMLGISARLMAISAGAVIGWNVSSAVVGLDTSIWPFIFTGFGVLFMSIAMLSFYLESIYEFGN